MSILMDLSLAGIYLSSFAALRKSPLVYLLLFLWGAISSIVLAILLFICGIAYLGSILAIANTSASGSAVLYVTAGYAAMIVIATSILSAATRAGILTYGSAIRSGKKVSALHFFKGITRFTLPLFLGGIIVGMLTAIPVLIFLLVAKSDLSGLPLDVFTSGWNYAKSLEIVAKLWNSMLMIGSIQLFVFFWISPWDEMVVLYELPYPEALMRSFTFVFSRRHFLRVISLILANVILAQILLISANVWGVLDGTHGSPVFMYLRILAESSSSTLTSFIQFIILPFFAYTQLYLLPWPERSPAETEPARSTEPFTADASAV